MPELLHEVWRNPEDDSLQMGPVRAGSDAFRTAHEPQSRCLHSFHAASWTEAQQAYHDWAGFGPYRPIENIPGQIYSDEELAEQQAYLKRRPTP
jgi:hypothetical protein